MGLFKQCQCANKDKCSHSWHMTSKGQKAHVEKWAGQNKLLTERITTRTQAKAIFARYEVAVLNGEAHQGMKPEGYTISDLMDNYLKVYFRPKGREYDNSEKYRFEAIRKKFGNVKPEDLRLIDVEKWVNELRDRGLGPSGVKRLIARLKAIMNWGFSREEFPVLRVRWRGLDLDPEGEGRARRLADGEEEKLKAAANPWLRQLIEAALDTGLRQSALLGLTFDMVKSDHLLVPRKLLKNKKATHDLKIPLTMRTRAIIEFRRCGPHGEKLDANRFIFGTKWGRQRKSFQGSWNAARKAAGVAQGANGEFDLHWHDLRGEFATRLHEAGVEIETISYLLDHSTIEMTRRYLKIRERSSRPAEAIAALEQLLAAFAAKAQGTQDAPPQVM